MFKKKIGIALGGGAVLGAAHIGVLKALEEYNVEVSYIAGTSIGGLVAAFYAFGKTTEEMEKVALELNWLDISAISLSQYGLLSNKKLRELIKENIGEVEFCDANIPLAMVATDISIGEKVVLNEGDIATAVMASSSIPGIFVPVEIKNRLLVDGGIIENVPVSVLKEMGAEFIIGVNLHSGRANKKPKNIIEVLLRSFSLALRSAAKLQSARADILLEPDLSSFNVYESDQTADLIEKGYKEAKKALKELF